VPYGQDAWDVALGIYRFDDLVDLNPILRGGCPHDRQNLARGVTGHGWALGKLEASAVHPEPADLAVAHIVDRAD
jgi:hypothetical protein